MSENKFSSFLDYFDQSISRNINKKALVIRRKIKKEIVTYKDFSIFLSLVENFLKEEKIRVGDKILIWGMNCPEYAILLGAIFCFARTAVPIDYRTNQVNVEAIIRQTSPKVAFVSKYLRFEFLKERKIKVIFLEDFLEYLKDIEKHQSLAKLAKKRIYTNPRQICEIIYTSGTTGNPKGVVLTQKALLSNIESAENQLPDLLGGRIISILPLSHMFEQIVGFLIPLGFGATIFYLPRINSFRLLKAFAEYCPTHQIFVPQLLKIIWDKIEDKIKKEGKWKNFQLALKIAPFLPSFSKRLIFGEIHALFGGKLQIIAAGGAPLEVAVGKYFTAVGLPVVEGYGATEVTAIATFNPIDRVKLGSVGKPVCGVSIHLDQNKEIYIKSLAQASGYYLDRQKTKKAFSNYGFKTGDIGEIDKEGYLHILGRDAFKIVLPSGEKVYVEDLENQVKEDSRVKDVCVVARRLTMGDRIHAYFILKKGVSDDLSSIVADINKNLESKQQIYQFERWKEADFPRTPTLKIDRAIMFAFANQEEKILGKKRLTPTENYYDILDILSKVSRVEKDKITDQLLVTTDLKLDSLSRVELVSLVEEYLGVSLDETKINAKTTVGQLKKMVTQGESIKEVKLPTWQFTSWGQFLHELVLRVVFIPFHAFLIQINFLPKKIPLILPGTIVIFNHPGVMDGMCVVRLLDKQGNLKMVTNATASLWEKRNPLAFWSEFLIGGLPLYESGQKLMKVLQVTSDLLDKGYNLLFAPQGTMQRGEEEDPFKLGIGYIVKELDRPVTIVRIKNYRQIWPAPESDIADSKLGDLLPRKRGKVRVIVSRSLKENWSKFSVVRITNLLEEKYRELL